MPRLCCSKCGNLFVGEDLIIQDKKGRYLHNACVNLHKGFLVFTGLLVLIGLICLFAIIVVGHK